MFCLRICLMLISVALVSVFGRGSHAGDEELPARGTVPPELIERLKKVLTEKAPDVTIKVELYGACSFANHCHEYRLHYLTGKGKTHGFKEKSSATLGPTADGFLLQLNWLRALGGGASGGGFQPVYAWNYCWLKSNAYKLNGEAGYLHLRWAYGPLTDLGILDLVRSEVEAYGKPVYDERSDGWNGKSATLKKNLAKILENFQADAAWRTEGETLVCQFKTMDFDVHLVDEKGLVTAEAHQETGPQHDGFIIRLIPLKKPYERQSRPVYGLSEGPYWREYFCVVDDPDHAFRLDLRYGIHTDKKLLNSLAEVLDHRVRENREF